MKFLKTACAVLTCFLLVAAQAIFVPHAQAAEQSEKSCACCSCKEMQCCVSSQPTPVPQQPTPAQTPRTVSQTQLQFVVTALAVISQRAAKAADDPIPTSLFSAPPVEVPLYTWNCSYLI